MSIKIADGMPFEHQVRAFSVPDDSDERYNIVQKGLTGNEKAKAAAVAVLRAYPDTLRIGYGDSVHWAVTLVAGENDVLQEVVRQEVKTRKKAILGENPTPLESLLADRVVACQLQVSHYECAYTVAYRKGMTLTQSEHEQRRIDRAHKRLLSATKALAQVRRLQLPAIQVNLAANGGQQVNVGQAVTK